MKYLTANLLLVTTLFTMAFAHADVFNEICLAEEVCDELCDQVYNSCENQLSIEARMAAFYPSGSRYKEVYGTCNPSYQLEITKNFSCWDGWANLEWISKKGHSYRLNDSTRISILNFSGGFKVPYALSESISAYAGLGFMIGGVFVRNHYGSSSSVDYYSSENHHKDNKFGFGVALKTGVNYFITCSTFIDFFADYQYQVVKFDTYTNIGGFKIGAGLGYKF